MEKNIPDEVNLVDYFRDCMEGGQSVYNRSQREFIRKAKLLIDAKDKALLDANKEINDLKAYAAYVKRIVDKGEKPMSYEAYK